MAVLIFLTVLSAVGAVVAVEVLRPDKDNAALVTAILGVIVPTTAALLALVRGNETERAVRDVHLLVNSRLTQLLEQTAVASRAQGKEEGRTGVIATSPAEEGCDEAPA